MHFHLRKRYGRGEPTGVPADHLPSMRSRHIAFDHQGRVTALVADGEPDGGGTQLLEAGVFGAIALSHTETSDASWNGPENEANLDNDDGESEYRKAFGWVNPDGDPDTKAAYAFIHHFVSADGDVGDASTVACSSGIGVLNGGRGAGSSADWWDDRKGIYTHLAGHLKDSGVKDEDLPELKDMTLDQVQTLAAASCCANPACTCSPCECTDGSCMCVASEPVLEEKDKKTFTTTSTPVAPQDLAARLAQLRERQAKSPEVPRTEVTVLTASGEVQMQMAVEWDDDAWDAHKWNPETGTFGAKGAFVSTAPGDDFAMVAAGADLPQIVDNPGAPWHAILCVEGLRTDEDPGREIMPGACQFPDLPVSLRLQIHDEGGHWGAVTCGRIDAMERQLMDGYNAIYAEGIFGTDEHGQTAQLLVTEQTQRFISIDPRACDMEIVEVEVTTSGYYEMPDEDPDLYDWWVRYTNLTIGAATIVATPALQQAVITLADVPLPETPIAVATAPPTSVTASGNLAAPPSDWFKDPGFVDGDSRLVRQPDGNYACPLTVTEDGRVYGHVAYWEGDHTAFPGRHRKPPHSATYAYFMTGSRRTADGTKVPVGNLTMGCGHASTSIRDANKVQEHYHTAHYDGGYGAVQMADVAAGEDRYGIWVAGALCEGVTAAEIRKFESLGLSGDWRERAGTLHMVACLAVPVPGFPITREEVLVAAANVVDSYAVRCGLGEDGDVYSMVAAGRVRRVPPEEQLATLQHQMDVVWGFVSKKLADEERRALLDLVGAE